MGAHRPILAVKRSMASALGVDDGQVDRGWHLHEDRSQSTTRLVLLRASTYGAAIWSHGSTTSSAPVVEGWRRHTRS